jgi:hypothetical protein
MPGAAIVGEGTRSNKFALQQDPPGSREFPACGRAALPLRAARGRHRD